MIVLKGRKIIPAGIKAVFLGRRKIFGKDGEEPVFKKLSAPVIRLETEGAVVPEGSTPAILGIAVLGKTILGLTSVLPKLSAPVIRIEEAEEFLKLETPVIRLETVSGGDPVVPQKLGTPVIRLETIEDGEEPEIPVITKLSAPVITLEMIDDEEPEIPVITKLDAPVIRMEEVTDRPEEFLTAELEGDVLYFNGNKEDSYLLVSPDERTDIYGMSLEIDGTEYNTIAAVKGENSFYLPEAMNAVEPGNYELYVSDGGRLSNRVTYRHGKLPAPKITISDNKLNAPDFITFTGQILVWRSVAGAEYYGITYRKSNAAGWILAASTEAPVNSYDLSTVIDTLEPGEYVFAVYATNVTEDSTGDWAETTYIKE